MQLKLQFFFTTTHRSRTILVKKDPQTGKITPTVSCQGEIDQNDLADTISDALFEQLGLIAQLSFVHKCKIKSLIRQYPLEGLHVDDILAVFPSQKSMGFDVAAKGFVWMNAKQVREADAAGLIHAADTETLLQVLEPSGE